MIKGILQIVFTILSGYFVQLYFPFWSMPVIAGLVALFFVYKNSLTSFAAGFIAAFLLWYAYAYYLDDGNAGLLSGKLGQLFTTESNYLPYASGFIGGIISGLGAMTGTLARKLFISQ